MSDTITIKGLIQSVSKRYDDKKKNVYFELDTSDKDLIRNSFGRVDCLGSIFDVQKEAPVKITGKFVNDVFECALIETTWISKKATVDYLANRCRAYVSSENEI